VALFSRTATDTLLGADTGALTGLSTHATASDVLLGGDVADTGAAGSPNPIIFLAVESTLAVPLCQLPGDEDERARPDEWDVVGSRLCWRRKL